MAHDKVSIERWSLHDVLDWMDQDSNKDLFGPYIDVFKTQEVDGALLVALSIDNLQEIGVDDSRIHQMIHRIGALRGSGTLFPFWRHHLSAEPFEGFVTDISVDHCCQACLRASYHCEEDEEVCESPC